MFKQLFHQQKNFRFVRFLSNKAIPCPNPPPLDPQCLKNLSEITKPMEITKHTLWEQTLTDLSPCVSYVTEFAPLFTLIASHHLLFMGVVVFCKEPSLLTNGLKNTANKTEDFVLAKRKLVVKRLAGMSDPNFNRLRGFSNFIFEPMRTMASYKEGTLETPSLEEEDHDYINQFNVVVMNQDRFVASIKLSHENFRLFVCTNTLIIMEDGEIPQVIIKTLMLPRLSYHRNDVSATLDSENLLMLEFRTPTGSPTAQATNCFMVSLPHV